MSAGPSTHIVLAIADPGLRSSLAAQLALAGELLILAENHLDPRLSPAIRATSLLVIERCLIAAGEIDWAATLRAQDWLSTIIVVVDANHDLVHSDDKIHFADRSDAGSRILALLQSWRSPSRASSVD